MSKLSMKGVFLIACGICLGGLLLGLFWLHLAREREAQRSRPEVLYPIKRQIQYGFTLQNEANRYLEKPELWVYAPVKQTATQWCSALEASHPYEVIEDDLGNQVLHFVLNGLAPYGTRIVHIKANLLLAETGNRIPFKRQNMDTFLKAERYIEVEAPEIMQIARKLKASNPRGTIENTFKWVSENVRYSGYRRSDLGALHALKNKEGDCTELMYLFMALCRANGIPSRGAGGYLCGGDSILKPNDYHNWAEFSLDGIWHVADPQRKVFMAGASQYLAMELLGEPVGNPMGESHRFRFAGEGLKVKMNQ